MTSLVERLGYPPDARLLIVNCDDLGSSRSANVAVYQALRDGMATSASLMVPCPWARDAAAMYRGEDVGVHLTLNAEWERYRWGPTTHSPSLLDGDGGFPRTLDDVWDHADLDEVRKECRTQIERAIYWGFDASHLDSHMGTLIEHESEIDRLMAETGPEVGLLLDTGHVTFAGGDPVRAAHNHAARVVHVHCKDIRAEVMRAVKTRDLSFLDSVLAGVFTVPGDGCVDYAAVLPPLAAAGYADWLVVEAEQDPAVAHPLTYARLGHDNLARFAKAAFG